MVDVGEERKVDVDVDIDVDVGGGVVGFEPICLVALASRASLTPPKQRPLSPFLEPKNAFSISGNMARLYGLLNSHTV